MKKIYLVLSGLMLIAASAVMTSCGEKGETASEAEPAQTATAGKDGGYKIAYVLIDTLTSNLKGFIAGNVVNNVAQ